VIFYFNYDENDDYSFNINFSNNHRFRIFVELPKKTRAKKFHEIAKAGHIYKDDPYCVYFDCNNDGNPLFRYYLDCEFDELDAYVEKAMKTTHDTLVKMGIISA
jgi:hypothetical protein